jgi:hypothetical protein
MFFSKSLVKFYLAWIFKIDISLNQWNVWSIAFFVLFMCLVKILMYPQRKGDIDQTWPTNRACGVSVGGPQKRHARGLERHVGWRARTSSWHTGVVSRPLPWAWGLARMEGEVQGPWSHAVNTQVHDQHMMARDEHRGGARAGSSATRI